MKTIDQLFYNNSSLSRRLRTRTRIKSSAALNRASLKGGNKGGSQVETKVGCSEIKSEFCHWKQTWRRCLDVERECEGEWVGQEARVSGKMPTLRNLWWETFKRYRSPHLVPQVRLQKDERNAVGQRTRVIVDFLHLRFRCQISHDVESWLLKRNLVNVHCPYWFHTLTLKA